MNIFTSLKILLLTPNTQVKGKVKFNLNKPQPEKHEGQIYFILKWSVAFKIVSLARGMMVIAASSPARW